MPSSQALFEFDRKLRNTGVRRLGGVDEVGRGPLAGPVVAVTMVLPEDFFLEGLNDSKLLRPKERARMARELVMACTDIGVGIIEAGVIDRVNILEATRLAMMAAVEDLLEPVDLLLVDALCLPRLKVAQKAIIRGDGTSACIAAASVIAKEIRDGIMLGYDRVYPQYEFRRHKGYGTAAHMKQLAAHGPCAIHRKSFAPVREQRLPFT